MSPAECKQVRELAAEVLWRETVAELMVKADEQSRVGAAVPTRSPEQRMADDIGRGLALMPVDQQREVAHWIRMHVITQLGAMTLPTPAAKA